MDLEEKSRNFALRRIVLTLDQISLQLPRKMFHKWRNITLELTLSNLKVEIEELHMNNYKKSQKDKRSSCKMLHNTLTLWKINRQAIFSHFNLIYSCLY